MEPITIELLKKTIGTTESFWWKLRPCSICGSGIGFTIDAEFWEIYFDSSCGCSKYATEVRFCSLRELLDTFNRQIPDTRLLMWKNFKEAVEKKQADG